jgi:vitamin B12 transporter
MKAIFTFLCLLPLLAAAQTRISGKVTDEKGGSVPGANVTLKDTYDGASTDAKGEFSFSTSESGPAVLQISFIGFQAVEKPVTLEGKDITLTIALKETVNELNTVTITAGAIEASDEKKAVLLRPLDIVTTAGANGDIYGAIQTLPGAQTVGESEGLFVRGGAASEAKTIIDGLTVQHPYQSSVPDIAQRGRFSPFLFRNTVFSTGGYSAQYGQAMSSALILETQDIGDRMNNTSIALMSIGGGIGHSHRWKRASAGVDLNYSNLSPYFSLVKQRADWVRMPQSGGGSFIFRYKTSKTGLLKVYATQGLSDLALRAVIDTSGTPLRFDLKNSNTYINTSYKEVLGQRWSLQAAASYSYNRDNRKFNDFDRSSSDNAQQGRVMLVRSLGRLSSVRMGTEAQRVSTYGGAIQNAFGGYGGFSDTIRENFQAVFAEVDWFLSSRLVARIGGRQEYSDLVNRSNIAPRLSLALKTGDKSQVSLAYGDFYQSPSLFFLGSSNASALRYEKATHYIAGYQSSDDKRTFRSEVYYKSYDNLVKFGFAPTAGFTELSNSGGGYARGIDIFWRDRQTLKYVDYWISYSYLDTKRDYLNYIASAQPTFAADHTFNLVFKRFFMKLKTSAGLTYTYASGRPYYNPNKVSPDNFLSDRTPDYHNLSVNASYLTNIKGHFTVIVLSVSNVLGIDNVFGYRYAGKNVRMPIRAPLPTFGFVGMFISIGKDRYEGVD